MLFLSFSLSLPLSPGSIKCKTYASNLLPLSDKSFILGLSSRPALSELDSKIVMVPGRDKREPPNPRYEMLLSKQQAKLAL